MHVLVHAGWEYCDYMYMYVAYPSKYERVHDALNILQLSFVKLLYWRFVMV